MASLVHSFEAPDRFVAGTVGEPGARTFFLQAREGNRITSVACEKQQLAVLTEHLERVLEEIAKRMPAGGELPPVQQFARDSEPLDVPITEEFRVGTMTIAWDVAMQRVVIEMFSSVEAEAVDLESDEDSSGPSRSTEASAEDASAAEAEQAEEVLIVKISTAEARDFIARANAVVSAGRPNCPFCLQPLEPEGHICPRANGYRRPLF